jgi:hypothetical protein
MSFVGGYADDWWKLSRRFERALQSASNRIDSDGIRRIGLGSPVLIGRQAGDVMRVPVILRGGKRELPVGYLVIESTRVDGRRIDALASHFEQQARAVIAGSDDAASRLHELTYP